MQTRQFGCRYGVEKTEHPGQIITLDRELRTGIRLTGTDPVCSQRTLDTGTQYIQTQIIDLDSVILQVGFNSGFEYKISRATRNAFASQLRREIDGLEGIYRSEEHTSELQSQSNLV